MTTTDDLVKLQQLQKIISEARNKFIPLREKIEKHFQVPEEIKDDILKVLEFEGKKRISVKSGEFQIDIKVK